MKRFANHTEPWGVFINVKHWPRIKDPMKYRSKEIFIGSVTDPYNPYEETFKRTQSLLLQLRGSGAKLSIATKSNLILRDLDLIKSFPEVRVSWSINTLDEQFKDDMDKAVSIERRPDAMRIFHDAGIRTTCFISPIFPGITDVESIISRVREQCNLIWLENLNLRGDYKQGILDYIGKKYPNLVSLYDDIYTHRNRDYWECLDKRLRSFAQKIGLDYLRDDDSVKRPFEAPPVIVNYFYHEEVRKSAKKETLRR